MIKGILQRSQNKTPSIDEVIRGLEQKLVPMPQYIEVHNPDYNLDRLQTNANLAVLYRIAGNQALAAKHFADATTELGWMRASTEYQAKHGYDIPSGDQKTREQKFETFRKQLRIMGESLEKGNPQHIFIRGVKLNTPLAFTPLNDEYGRIQKIASVLG